MAKLLVKVGPFTIEARCNGQRDTGVLKSFKGAQQRYTEAATFEEARKLFWKEALDTEALLLRMGRR